MNAHLQCTRHKLASITRERDAAYAKQAEMCHITAEQTRQLASVTKDAERYRLIATSEEWLEGVIDAFYMGKQYVDEAIDAAIAKIGTENGEQHD